MKNETFLVETQIMDGRKLSIKSIDSHRSGVYVFLIQLYSRRIDPVESDNRGNNILNNHRTSYG